MSMSELQIGAGDPPAIFGEIEAGRSSRVRKEITKLIKGVSTNTFDLADLLHESKAKQFYTEWGFESFSKYAKSLDIKYTKCYYLVSIIENMVAAGLKRPEYEAVGLAKLRTISRLKPVGEYLGSPMPTVIRELTLRAESMTPEEVTTAVDTILGLTDDESMVWLNIKLKKLARENVVAPALALAKKHIGTVATDDEGQAKDASDGAALEMICANFLADPNYNTDDEPTVSEIEEVTNEVAAELESE